MPWKIAVSLVALAPFAALWLAFAVYEMRRTFAQVRAPRGARP